MLKLMRPKHWLKNGLIAAALFFGGRFTDFDDVLTVAVGVALFCLISSAVYILNDIFDAPSDRLHEIKKNRPIASGAVSVRAAGLLLAGLVVVVAVADILFFRNFYSVGLLALYFILNIAYSIKLKHVPIFDVVILASGFIIRVFYGAVIISQPVSNWLLLTTLAMSLFAGFGKRRNELKNAQHRKVLEYYNQGFLDKSMYACMTLTLMFYSLWAMQLSPDYGVSLIVLTIPIVIIICLRYSLLTETKKYADPVEILLGDKILLLLLALCGILMLIYFV